MCCVQGPFVLLQAQLYLHEHRTGEKVFLHFYTCGGLNWSRRGSAGETTALVLQTSCEMFQQQIHF